MVGYVPSGCIHWNSSQSYQYSPLLVKNGKEACSTLMKHPFIQNISHIRQYSFIYSRWQWSRLVRLVDSGLAAVSTNGSMADVSLSLSKQPPSTHLCSLYHLTSVLNSHSQLCMFMWKCPIVGSKMAPLFPTPSYVVFTNASFYFSFQSQVLL